MTISRALSFDTAAARYDAARPGYPPALFDAVEELAGRPLDRARVLDVGAGTGIATRLLRARGARVTAVEPGPGMAGQFRRATPGVRLVRATGDALPFAAATADLVTYAQSWHWTDPARSLPEALRVLRPGGTLALWWNTADAAVDWVAAQEERLRRDLGGAAHGAHDRERSLPAGIPRTDRRVRWSRRVPLDTHLAHLGSHSLLLTAEPGATRAFLERERAELLAAFPDGTVIEPYTVHLTTTRRPTA
ncbi:class I SAM-dependent methyltransferase [Streptomyces sp. NPDC046887]|uniref:class I SAM-dependent methyltransferase n=1 Tax=Streptomyces sp. NPDC046887 TaxID=3155472 RepID=UPI0033FB64D2